MHIASLAEDVDVVEYPVQEVEAARYYIGNFQKSIRVALVDDLDALELKQRLEDAKQLTGFSHSFYLLQKNQVYFYVR